MYVHISVHRPKPGKEQALIESMVRFGKAMREKRGLITVFVWKDDRTGALIGTALWDSKADFEAAGPDMERATEGVDFETLEESVVAYRGSPVGWA